ncbi:MAG: TonB-dependent receptor [Steroidobacteraceae bacterium]|nr:TonB-dependent receptor [Steroidobacteraceae bacterium]
MRSKALALGAPLAPMLLAGTGVAYAQQETSAGLEEIIVTAQKRAENLQSVPISIQALGSQRLEELKISEFRDYVKFLPSIAFTSAGPGFSLPYFRGVASGENNNHSGPSPSVGIYLDEQPITTIQGALDIHIYDIARIEALAGPQGTLFGASSQAGTIRIITNQPDPSGFEAGYGVEGNYVEHGDAGYLFEGFVNIPVSEAAAVRLVGWARHDAGYIDNVVGERTFPTSGICMTNARNPSPGCVQSPERAKDNYNDVDTYGARAALRVDLNDTWSITPSLVYQSQDANGSFSYDPAVGELELHTYYPTFSEDEFTQAALTVQGKIGNFDLVYAGAYLKRDVLVDSDYSDYAFFYDTYYTDYCAENPTGDYCWDWGGQFVNDSGNLINPSQFIHGTDGYTMQSHEIRIASPTEDRFRVVAGLFWQDFEHEILQRYQIKDLSSNISVPLWQDTIWLTNQLREDQSQAVFGEIAFDFTTQLTGTAGIRYYEYDNSLRGFFGFNENYYAKYGTAQCFSDVQYNGSPCTNLDAKVDDSGTVPKLNLTYRFDDDRLMYATYSEGFRPGGVNRNDGSPYDPDYLKNYEIGWKTTWADGRVRVNGAVFHEEWDDIQYGYLPPGGVGLTVIRNVGAAEIDGIEADLAWAPTDAWTISGGFTWLDAALTKDYYEDPEDPPAAFKGDRLPVTPEFKANATGRYQFPLGDFAAYGQAAIVYTGDSYADLTRSDRSYTGLQDAYTIVDLAFGLSRNDYTIDFFLKNAFDELAQTNTGVACAYFACGGNPYYYPNQPRTIGVRFSQDF